MMTASVAASVAAGLSVIGARGGNTAMTGTASVTPGPGGTATALTLEGAGSIA